MPIVKVTTDQEESTLWFTINSPVFPQNKKCSSGLSFLLLRVNLDNQLFLNLIQILFSLFMIGSVMRCIFHHSVFVWFEFGPLDIFLTIRYTEESVFEFGKMVWNFDYGLKFFSES